MSLQLNLASGQRPFAKPWTNVDCQPRWNPDVLTDIRDMPMFVDSSASMIVGHHCIEHLHMADADRMLRECHRILEPGGSLILLWPNLKALATRWLTGRINDFTFFVNCMGADMGDPADIHRWHYTLFGMVDKLKSCGKWNWIQEFDWRPIPGADIAKDFWIQGVEAMK